MLLVKKFFFSLPFVVSFICYSLLLRQFLENPNLLFGIDMETIFLFIKIVAAAMCTGFFFALFVTISQDKKIIMSPLPAILLSSYLLLPENSGIVVAIGSCFVFLFAFLSLKHTLNTYISFSPGTQLSPHIKQIVTLLFLLGSFAFYLSFQQIIQKQGFLLPQPIFDAIQKAIPEDQSQQLIQSQIKQQISTFIKPFESFLAIIFAVIFFFNLRFLAAIFGLLLGPLLYFIFWILDKTKFTTYTTETRIVRKLIV